MPLGLKLYLGTEAELGETACNNLYWNKGIHWLPALSASANLVVQKGVSREGEKPWLFEYLVRPVWIKPAPLASSGTVGQSQKGFILVRAKEQQSLS